MEGWEVTMADVAEPSAEASGLALGEPLMTADEVAAALGVHRKFVHARQRSGDLRGYKLGPTPVPACRRARVPRGERGPGRRIVGAVRSAASLRAGGIVPGAAGRACG